MDSSNMGTDDILQQLNDHAKNCPPHVQALTGDKPKTWTEALEKLDALESMAEVTDAQEDRDAYFWYAKWMLLTGMYLTASRIEDEETDVIPA